MSKQKREDYQDHKNSPIPVNNAAAYNPIFKSKYSNKNSIYNYIPEIKDKLDNHELQHYKDHLYVKNKYGASAAKKILAKSIENNKHNVNDKKYRRDSMEYNAVNIGSKTNSQNKTNIHSDLQKDTRHIMDKAVHGKRTPKISDEMLNRQTPPLF